MPRVEEVRGAETILWGKGFVLGKSLSLVNYFRERKVLVQFRNFIEEESEEQICVGSDSSRSSVEVIAAVNSKMRRDKYNHDEQLK